jgi:hypothetical protein
MPNLFGRTYSLEVDTLKFSDRRVKFEVEKTLAPNPNTAQISIFNLSETDRKKLTLAKYPVVRLAAGYAKTSPTQIFYGQLIHVEHNVVGEDMITTLTTGDGAVAYRTARVEASFGPKTKIDSVLKTLIKALGLRPGNSQKALAELAMGKFANIYLQGTVVSGPVAHQITQLTRSAGLSWSIQDGAVQILDLNPLMKKFAIVLDPTSGLVGSPAISNKGVVSGKCLIVPDMIPGRQILLRSKFLTGQFQLDKVTYEGDNYGDAWYCTFEGSGLQTSPSRSKAKKRVNVKHAK